jgi:flagellar assembly protein FliH
MSWSEAESRRAAVVPREAVAVHAPVSPSGFLREVVAAGTVDAVLAEAREEAERLRREAREARDQAFQEARQAGEAAGREAGFQAGLAAGREEGLRQLAEEAQAVLDEVEELLAREREDAVADLAALGIELASRLYGQQIEADPDHVADVVRALLAETSPHAPQLVEVNALDLPAVIRTRDEWRRAAPQQADVRVVPVSDLARGACRILTDGGWLERDWPERLQDLARLLAKDGGDQP